MVAFALTRGFFKIVNFIGAEQFTASGQNVINGAIDKWNEARRTINNK